MSAELRLGSYRLTAAQASALLDDMRMVLTSRAADLLQALELDRWEDAAQMHDAMTWQLAVRAELDGPGVRLSAPARSICDYAAEGIRDLADIDADDESLSSDDELGAAFDVVLTQGSSAGVDVA